MGIGSTLPIARERSDCRNLFLKTVHPDSTARISTGDHHGPRPRDCLFQALVMFVLLSAVSIPALAEMPPLPRGKGEYCVEPTDVMRKEHMNFLLHQRDKTVYDGIRTKQHSLNNCVDCHVQTNAENEFIPIDAPGQFCEVCHTYTSVKLDCFECHATRPDGDPTQAHLDAAHGPLVAKSFRSRGQNSILSPLERGTELNSVPGGADTE